MSCGSVFSDSLPRRCPTCLLSSAVIVAQLSPDSVGMLRVFPPPCLLCTDSGWHSAHLRRQAPRLVPQNHCEVVDVVDVNVVTSLWSAPVLVSQFKLCTVSFRRALWVNSTQRNLILNSKFNFTLYKAVHHSYASCLYEWDADCFFFPPCKNFTAWKMFSLLL